MTCHICLSTNDNQKIDRLDLCEVCYKEVIRRLEEYEKKDKS